MDWILGYILLFFQILEVTSAGSGSSGEIQSQEALTKRRKTCQWLAVAQHSRGAAVTRTRHSFLIDQGYTRVTSGSTCERITSKAECEKAARKLGLSDTTASKVNKVLEPPYCFFKKGAFRGLYFNSNGNSNGQCQNIRVCICKETSALTVTDISSSSGKKFPWIIIKAENEASIRY